MEFLRIREADLELVLKWRTSEFVTRYMYTDIEYDLAKQRAWYERIQQEANSRYWLIASKGKKFGLVSINQIDWFNKRASWAFYIGEPSYSMAAGMIGPHLYNYAFKQLGLRKLTGEVLGHNSAVRRMHLANGCREAGCLKEHIQKDDQLYDVYVYEMLAKDWVEKTDKLKNMMPQVEE